VTVCSDGTSFVPPDGAVPTRYQGAEGVGELRGLRGRVLALRGFAVGDFSRASSDEKAVLEVARPVLTLAGHVDRVMLATVGSGSLDDLSLDGAPRLFGYAPLDGMDDSLTKPASPVAPCTTLQR
jgi:hypothetical protein